MRAVVLVGHNKPACQPKLLPSRMHRLSVDMKKRMSYVFVTKLRKAAPVQVLHKWPSNVNANAGVCNVSM
jgi:hypothetical protein